MAGERSERDDLRFQQAPCSFLNKDVWAILARQPDGTWRTINCLDKDEACFRHECRFTTDGGTWPFLQPSAPPPASPT